MEDHITIHSLVEVTIMWKVKGDHITIHLLVVVTIMWNVKGWTSTNRYIHNKINVFPN